MVLRGAPHEGTRARLELRYIARPSPATPEFGEGLGALEGGNPAARSLPLLRALASRNSAVVTLPLGDDSHLEVRVAPC